jgi:tRNA (guanine37-N1)-methyltransferase
MDEVRRLTGASLIGTTARRRPGGITWEQLAARAASSDVCLAFGTGWGMSESLLESFEAVVEPIAGRGGFNHLSVRSAVAIALDRIA